MGQIGVINPQLVDLKRCFTSSALSEKGVRSSFNHFVFGNYSFHPMVLEGSILQKLEARHRTGEAGRSPLSLGVYYKNTLVSLCHALEDCVLSASSKPLMLAAFQLGKWYLQEADRYNQLADCARNITILAAPDGGFAEHPTSQRDNVNLVSLDPLDPVAQEWHLFILAPTYTAMVMCQELSEADYGSVGSQPTVDCERKFYGFWTFEPKIVLEAVDLLIDHVGHYDPTLQQTLRQHRHEVAQTSDRERDDCGPVVARVVNYLKTNQADLPLGDTSHVHRKLLDRNLVSNELQAFLHMAELVDVADADNPEAAAEVAMLSETLGQLLDLPAWQLKRLRLASLLHRIGPLQGLESDLAPGSSLHYQESGDSCPLSCPLVPGAQVLRTLPRLRAIAQIVAHRTEWWNGSGQPAGLIGDEIPLESQILGLAAAFQCRVHQARAESAKGTAYLTPLLQDFQAEQGERWNPQLVEVLSLLVMGLQQGMEIPVSAPNAMAGMWLLESEANLPLKKTLATAQAANSEVTGGSRGS